MGELVEFACPCCGAKAKPSARLLQAKADLEAVTGCEFRVSGSCRCPKHNRQIGGSPKSQHLINRFGEFHAFDLVPLDDSFYLSDLAIAAFYEVPAIGGVGYYPESHLHIDDRDYVSRKSSWVALKRRRPDGSAYFVYLKWSF